MGLAKITFRSRCFDWSRVYVAGVLNVTPDSFSDGGLYLRVDDAVARGRALIEAGADILDIGGESTRPGAAPVDEATEIARVEPVIRALAGAVRVPISVDTTKAAVARAALAAGAEIVNDISGGLFDPAIYEVTAAAGAAYICGHVRGRHLAEVHAAEASPPAPEYLFEEVAAGLAERLAALPGALRARTIVDPGLGFGKRLAQNLALIRRCGELAAGLGCPVMIGPSRKRFVAEILDASGDDGDGGQDLDLRSMDARDRGTVGACLAAAGAGANLVRVHDVALVAPALRVYEALVSGPAATPPGRRPEERSST